VRTAGRVYLFNDLGGSDYAPTASHRAVHAELRTQLGETKRRSDSLISGDLSAFNTLLRDRGLSGIIR
jgi:hypothetical protein